MMNTAGSSSPLRNLNELVTPRTKRPETVLTLENAVADRLGTIRSFVLAPSIRKSFEQVLDAVAERRGRAFWVQSEYGGGKTHFISALTALVAHDPRGDAQDRLVWDAIEDAELRSRAGQFVPRRILSVAVSCKGIMPLNGEYSRALLRLLMDGIGHSLKAHGLEDKVPITPDQESIAHFHARAPEMRQAIDVWSRNRHAVTVTELYETEGAPAAARAYRQWWAEEAGGEPILTMSVVDWLTGLSDRLQAVGFDGLFVVIDEFATLQNLATSQADVSAYEDVLEALGWLVPERLRQRPESTFGVTAVVASQRSHPVKLDQRFTLLPLLAENAAEDYEIIVSRRVRTLVPGHEGEVDQYYYAYALTHDTYRHMPVERFREVFPFQPRVFDAIWQLTASGGEVAATRFGIAAVWDCLQQPGILAQSRLLTVSDLLRSPSFQNDLREAPDYKEGFAAYRAAREALPSLNLVEGDLPLAEQVLDALFVDYLAHWRSPRFLTARELADAVLAESAHPVIPAEDHVLTLLGALRDLRQVTYEAGKGGQFSPTEGIGPSPTELFKRTRDALNDDDPALAEAWAELLGATAPTPSLWAEYKLGTAKTVRAYYERVQFTGLAELRATLGPGSAKHDLSPTTGEHFHVIMLIAPCDVSSEDLWDPRVAVVVPAALEPAEVELCKTVVAARNVLQDPSGATGPDAQGLRSYADGQLRDAVQRLISHQTQVFRRGAIVTRSGVAISSDAVFHVTKLDDAFEMIVKALLDAAYTRFDHVVRPSRFLGSSRLAPSADVGKLFAGLIGGSTTAADHGAAQNFGHALGLRRPIVHDKLDLEREHPALALILDRLAGAGAAGITTESVFEALSGPPYGVPAEVVTLWVLACVRDGTIGMERRHIELGLQRNGGTRLKGGQTVPDDTLTYLNVARLDWANNLRKGFFALQISEEAPFTEVVAYARSIDPTLKVPADVDGIADQEERLRNSVAQAMAQASETRTALRGLAQALDQAIPPEVGTELDRLCAALAPGEEYERARQLALFRDHFADATVLASAYAQVQKWRLIASRAAELADLHRFARNLVSRIGDAPSRYHALVGQASLEVLPRLGLAALLTDPHALESALQDARLLQGAFTNEYRLHHRDHFVAVVALRSHLDGIRPRVGLLARLNRLGCAGPPTLGDAEERLAALDASLRLCTAHERADVKVGTSLVCEQDCGLPGLDPLARIPNAQVETLAREIDTAIQSRLDTIKARAVSAILEESPEPGMAEFLAAVQASQLEQLMTVLDDRLTGLIDAILEREHIRVVPAGVLGNLAERYPVIQESQINEVTESMRKELEGAFRRLGEENPGATIQLRLGGGA